MQRNMIDGRRSAPGTRLGGLCAQTRRGGVLKALGIGCLVFVVLIVILGIVVAVNFKNWSAAAVSKVAEMALEQSDLPEDQRSAISKQIERVKDGFKNGEITSDQLGRIMQELDTGGLVQLGFFSQVHAHVLQTAELSEKCKKAVAFHRQRFARGVIEGKIDPGDVQSIIKPYLDESDRRRGPKRDITQEEAKGFFRTIEEEADQAEVPREDYEIDYAGEFGKVIDRHTGQEFQSDAAPSIKAHVRSREARARYNRGE